MISFECDYNNGACQQVMDNLVRHNVAKPTPYGFDEFSNRAKQRIREACGLPDAQIFFLTGGTQTNATTIDSMLYQVCRHYEIPLYIDGARLGYGLMAEDTDVTLPYLARHCDVFYIGGTKIGALCGEAVVFTNMKAHKHFFSIQKQHGAVIAKGALIGLQFDALFTDNLYFRLSEQGIRTAMRMKEIFKRKGFTFYIDSPTNQQFVVMGNEEAERLSRKVGFTRFGQTDHHHTICRFVTSWATTNEEIDELEELL